jgi:hypothetical protein
VGARRPAAEWLLLCAALLAYATLQFGQLGHPLLWQDEGETAMYAERVLEYGYPVVHGKHNVVYEFGSNVAQGVKEGLDAYIGTPWGHFYFAVPGLLWAAGVRDPWLRTRRLRLPFALAGAAGLALMLGAVLPVYRGRRRRAVAFAACFFGLAASSVSLQLHLREVRYYPLLVLCMGAVLWLHLRHAVFGLIPPRRYRWLLAPLLWLLWNVFYPAWFAVTGLLALERAATAWRSRGAARREALGDLLPLALAAVAVAPLLVFFETFQIAGAFSREQGLGLGGFAANLGRVGLHFLRHELLGPLLVVRALVLWSERGSAAARDLERRVAGGLALFALGYAAAACVNPLAYERYFVVLSPIVSLVFLLDAFRLGARLPARLRLRHARGWTAAGLLALLGLSLAARLPELRGRLLEITTPYRGPLDFVVPYLLDRYPHSEALIVATNYENHPLMYYLGSRVIVGTSLANITRDRLLEPDVVIPRRRWRRGLDELRRFLAAGDFERHRFPVEDLRWNNIPALSRSPWVPDPHRFRTPLTADEALQLEIYERVPRGG